MRKSLTEDLSGTNMHTLPQYIFGLVTLQKLLLRNCEILMMELPPEIGDLKNLEVLDLEGTEILCLPMEIAKLVNLTCLKVSFYGYANQTVIPKTVLSNLSRLKELIIDVTPYGEWWDVEVKDIIDDLRNLKELTSLKLSLPTAELLEDLTLILPGLANFRFTVGRHEEHFISRLPRNVEEEFNNQEKGLKFINGNCIPNEITKVLKHANAFFLQRHWTAESLSEFGHENLNEVKFFLVMECNEFWTIIDSEKLYQGKDERAESEDFPDFDEAMVLGSLQRLIIRYMKHMESIWKGPVAKGSLSNLKSLALHTCPKLTTLFTIDMLSYLINLEELIVEDCPKINSLVSHQNSGSKLVLFLPSLRKISLLHLPGLVSISSGQEIAPKLERMVVFYCPKLKLSATEVSSKELKVIKGDKEWWDALKWYESDLSTEDEDYLARLFIPLRKDGDLMAQLTEEEIAGYGQGEVGSFKLLDCLSNFSEEELLEEISLEELEEIPSEELEETPSNPRELEDESDQNDHMLHFDQDVASFAAMDREVVSLSMGKRLSANKFGEMASIHSTSPYFSEDVGKIDTLFAQVAESSLSPPAAGSPLQDHFRYSNRYHLVNRFGKGSPSGRSEREKVEDPKKVTSQKNSVNDVSQESEDTIREDQLKAGQSFFGGITTKSFKDSSESNQTIEISSTTLSKKKEERSSTNVTVNGHPMSDHLLKKAEKFSGPIQLGHYWYDYRAGFWGVMGGPCLGIIPPFIEEFDYRMPKNCAGGNTSVFVNGRELHQEDLRLLSTRGLPTTRDRSYIIEITGRVWDEDAGEELDSLGKLAPTVEKAKRGFGMRAPRV